MIKGIAITYNPSQIEVIDIIGSVCGQSGLEFYFHHLYSTFHEAESALTQDGRKYIEEFKNETYDIRQSMFLDPSHQIQGLPLIETLRKSYFVVIHSEIEKIWKEIQCICNKISSQKTFKGLNYGYVHDTNNILDKIASKYNILFAYNLIRNKIIHPNLKDRKYEFPKEFMENYDKGNIEYFKIINDAGKMNFIITDMKFGKKYSEIFIQLLNEIKQNL